MFDSIMELCGYIAVIGGALILLYKGYKFIVHPHEEMNDKLDNDYRRLEMLEERLADVETNVKELKEANKLIIDSLYQMLDHFETQNNTGGMRESKKNLIDFLNK